MAESKHDGLAIPGRVVLAHEPAFSLGIIRVLPATRQVEAHGSYETVEPRVMEVLVALARSSGEVLTRDELIDRCWDGRIVTDDAINRVLSRIRGIANGIGEGSFALETIARVGYRLVRAEANGSSGSMHAPTTLPIQPKIARRTLIAGASAALVGLGAAALLWERPWQHRPDPEARLLYDRGIALTREGLPGQIRQAVSYFERAVAVDPQFSEAWGQLALSYSHLFEGSGDAEVASLPGRIEAAGQRALRLDPENADARLGLIFMTPFFRNWRTKEIGLRAVIRDHPRHWLAHARLAVLLYQVGRLEEGIREHSEALRIEPMLPVAYFFQINNLSALGRAQEAEALIERAHDHWPAHPALWNARFNHLLFSGRPRSAAAFAMNPDALPSGFGPQQVESRLAVARAMETRQPADVESVLDTTRELAAADGDYIPVAAPLFAVLGHPDLVFAILERYFFDEGPFGSSAPIGPFTRRSTDFLFTRPMDAVRSDPRFAHLVRKLGLESYWQRTATVPDYRRS